MQMYIVIVKDVVNNTLARRYSSEVLTVLFSVIFDAMVCLLALCRKSDRTWYFKAQGGLLNSAMLLGMGVSSMLVGRISDKYGRKKALLFSLALFIVFAGSVFFVRAWVAFFCFNFCSGLGLGGIWSCSAALINETWPAGERGKASAIVMSAGQLGMMFSTILTPRFLRATGWRYLYLTAAALLAVIYFNFVMWMNHLSGCSQATGGVKSTVLLPLGHCSVGCALIRGGHGHVTCFYCMGINTWLPTYLVEGPG